MSQRTTDTDPPEAQTHYVLGDDRVGAATAEWPSTAGHHVATVDEERVTRVPPKALVEAV